MSRPGVHGSINGSVRSKPYRGSNFPYHLDSPGTAPNGFKLNSFKSSSGISRPSTAPIIGGDTPSSYMVLNFRNQFVDEGLIEKLTKDVKIEEKRLRQLQQECNNPRTNSAPGLVHSFLLPRKVKQSKVEPVRNMIGRADASTQADTNLNKREFDGLSEYQKWTGSEVEPFFKAMKIAVKAQRPDDIYQYCIAYCQALAAGEAPPDTIEQQK